MQRAALPFAGIAAAAPWLGFKRLFLSPGPIFEAQDFGDDPWGCAPALAAAGFQAGEIVLNCFSYHLTPGGFIMESGAHALGCATIPAGPGNTEQTLQAIAQLRPDGPIARAARFRLKILLDKSGRCFGRRRLLAAQGARVRGRTARQPRAELEGRGVQNAAGIRDRRTRRHRSARPTKPRRAPPRRVCKSPRTFVEIVRPGRRRSRSIVALGAVGENRVVTALRGNFPLLRFSPPATFSAFLDPTRIRGWMGRADQTTKVKGMFVHPSRGRRNRQAEPSSNWARCASSSGASSANRTR